MGEAKDPLAEARARFPHCFIQARRWWDPFPRQGMLPWDANYAKTVGDKVWKLYCDGVPFYTKETIQYLEIQISNYLAFQLIDGVRYQTEEYNVPGLDGEQHLLEVPWGTVVDVVNNLSMLYLSPIVKFTSIQGLAMPYQRDWDARKAFLPAHVTNWCIRTDLPPTPVLPVNPTELITEYRRRTVEQVHADVERRVRATTESDEWKELNAAMLVAGLTPNVDMFRKVLIFMDSDIMRVCSTWAEADLTVLAFAIAFSRLVQANSSPAPDSANTMPVCVSESTSETPLSRDPVARELFRRLGVAVIASDARLLLEVDECSVVVERGISEVPLRQIIADFSMPKADNNGPYVGPPMIVRPALRDDVDDFEVYNTGVQCMPEPLHYSNPDSPRTRAMMKEYHPVKPFDPHNVLETTTIYLRKVPEGVAELFRADPTSLIVGPVSAGGGGAEGGVLKEQGLEQKQHEMPAEGGPGAEVDGLPLVEDENEAENKNEQAFGMEGELKIEGGMGA